MCEHPLLWQWACADMFRGAPLSIACVQCWSNIAATTLTPPFHCHIHGHKCCAGCCSLPSSKQAMAYAVRVAATFAVSWMSPDRRTGLSTEDCAPRADAHDLRVSRTFRAGRGKLRVLAVDHFVLAPITMATAVHRRVSGGCNLGENLRLLRSYCNGSWKRMFLWSTGNGVMMSSIQGNRCH